MIIHHLKRLGLASILAGSVFVSSAMACNGGTCNTEGVYFNGLHDNSAVSQTFEVKMAVHGMKIHKAGKLVDGTGHFHILIDTDYVKKGSMVKKDAQHIHFGKGQIETSLTLSPGEHTLTLQLADGHHKSYGKNWSKTIGIYVKP
ncbi:MAG: DUF4399 domain-containing protein [Ghiorsea sp.]